MKRIVAAVAAVLCAASAASADEGHRWTGFSLGLTGAGSLGRAIDITETAPPAVFGTAGFLLGATG